MIDICDPCSDLHIPSKPELGPWTHSTGIPRNLRWKARYPHRSHGRLAWAFGFNLRADRKESWCVFRDFQRIHKESISSSLQLAIS